VKRAFAEINLEQIKNNFLAFKKLIAPQTQMMAVVKADAYGLGAVPVSETCLAYGATFLGVAWVGEAKEIREAGITAPILILSEPPFESTRELVELELTQTVFSEEYIDKLEKQLKNINQTLKVHLKIDTGMGRIGTSASKALELIDKIEKSKHLKLEGVFTHFACADEKNNPYTSQQLSKFNEIVNQIKQKINRPLIFHAANTAGVENFPESQFNMVRIGIGLYRQALTLKSYVIYIKEMSAGESISYGSTFTLKQNTKIATVCIGYADGYSRILSNKTHVLINGQKFPQVGRITMDMLMVDIGNSNVKVGDEVVLIGRQGQEYIDATEIASLMGTNEYEVLTNLGKKRVQKVKV